MKAFQTLYVVAFEFHLNIGAYCSSQLFPQVSKLLRVLRNEGYKNSDQFSDFKPPKNNRKSKVFWFFQGDKSGKLANNRLRHD